MKSNYEKLGLPDDAPKSLVEKKYSSLMKQFKNRTDEFGVMESDVEYYEDITGAYNEIMGFNHNDYDDNPTSVIPRPIRMVLGKWATIFDSYKLTIMIIVVLAIAGYFIVIQMGTNKKEDISIKIAGAFALTAVDSDLETEIANKSNAVSSPAITFYTIDINTHFNVASTTESTQFLGQLTYGQIDLMIMDIEVYNAYVDDGFFIELSDYIETNKNNPGFDKIIPIVYSVEDKSGIYAIDATNCAFFEDLSINYLDNGHENKQIIIAVCMQSKRQELALSLASEIISTYKENIETTAAP